VDRIEAGGAVWFDGVLNGPGAVARPGERFDAQVQVRAHGTAVPARVHATVGPGGDAAAEVELTGAALRGVAAGQSLVVYAGTRVLGQATVDRAYRARPGETGGAYAARSAQPAGT
jgi:tRNA-uridine 2-sulfurtransferase